MLVNDIKLVNKKNLPRTNVEVKIYGFDLKNIVMDRSGH